MPSMPIQVGTGIVTTRILAEAQRGELAALGRLAAALLETTPQPLLARYVKARLGLGESFSTLRLVKAMRANADVIRDKKNGHEARWAHRCWLPVLVAHYRWPRALEAPGPDAPRAEVQAFIERIVASNARGEVLIVTLATPHKRTIVA